MASKQEFADLEATFRRLAETQVNKSRYANPKAPNPWDKMDLSSLPKISQIPDSPGPIDRLTDVLSRGGYAIRNLIKDSIDDDPNTNNPLESLWAGLSGIDKTSTTDVIDLADSQDGTKDVPDWVRGAIGLAGDLLIDPLNFVPLGGVGRLAAKGAKAATGGKFVTAAEKEAGHVVPNATSANDAITRNMPEPPPQVQGAGAHFVARADAAHQPPVTELGMPSIKQTREQQLIGSQTPEWGDFGKQRNNLTPEQEEVLLSGLNKERGIGTLDTPRTQPESIPLFDELGRDTYRLSNAGPKAAAPAFDLAKMGDDLKNLAATDPQQLRRVGLNGPTVAAHAGEQQLGLFGKGDLTSAAPIAEQVAETATPVADKAQKALFTQREMGQVAKIPMSWSPELRNVVKEAAAAGPPSKNAMKLSRKVNQEADRIQVNEVVARTVDEQPAITQPVTSTLTPAQVESRASAWSAAREVHANEMDVRANRARAAAYMYGQDEKAAYKALYGDTSPHTPRGGKATAPKSTANPEIDAAVAATGTHPAKAAEDATRAVANETEMSLSDAARMVIGKEPVEVLQNGRKITEPARLDMRSQWTHAASVVTQVNKELTEAGLRGEQLAQAKMAEVMTRLEAYEAAHISKGIYPEISASGNTYRLSTTDVWKSLPPKVLRDMQFTQRNIPISSQLTAAAKTIALVQSGVTDSAKAIREIAAALSAKPGAHWTGQEIAASGRRAQRNATAMWAARDELYKKMLNNEQTFKTRDAVIGKQVGEEVADDVVRRLNDPEVGIGSSMDDIAHVNETVTRLVRERGASAGAAAVGSHAANARMASEMPAIDVATARSTTRNNHRQSSSTTWNRSREGTSGTAQEARQATQANANETIRTIEAAAVESGVQLDELTGFTSDGLFKKILHGLLSRFSGGYGMDTFFAVGRGQLNHFGDASGKYAAIIDAAQLKHKLPDTQAAWESIRVGKGKEGLTAEQAAAYDDLLIVMPDAVSMSRGVTSWGDTAMFRESLDPETINGIMHKHSIKYDYRPKDNNLEVPEQWREWEGIENPWQFLTNMHHAQMELAARSGIGRYATKEFGSRVMKPGYVKIARTQNRSDLSHVIDTDLYYPREVAESLARYSRNIDQVTSFKGPGVGAKLMNEWLDPFLSMWKTSTTIIRPGHQVRNYIGDVIQNGMDGVVNPLAYARAAKVQAANGGFKMALKSGDLQEAYKSLGVLTGKTMPKPTGTLMSVTLKNGKTVPIANNQLYWLAHQSGLLLDYRPAEDILRTGGKKLGVVANKVEDLGYVKRMGQVSTLSSDNTRLAHIIGLMSDPKVSKQYDSLESMMNGLTARVQKFHPDVKGLTPFEQKYMRRVVPYYSWFKQAMPTLFMTTLTKPARVTAIPKAQYNLNVALGGDPQDIGNQFSANQLYPSFLRNTIGGPLRASGAGNDSGFLTDFGSPVEAAASMFNGDVGENLGGMLNPLIQTPWGIASGSHPLNSEHYIPDKGEWIDKSLPFLNQIANVTGYSPSGSLETLLSEGKIDPQRATEKGEKDFLFNQNLTNFLTGLNIQETNRPSYRKIARSENLDYQKAHDPFNLLRG